MTMTLSGSGTIGGLIAGGLPDGTIQPADLTTGAPSWNSSGVFSYNSGYGTVAPVYGCRAWVNFNGTGTVAIRASGNVSSITDNGTGDYTLNFTNAMPDVNYVMSWNAQNSFNADWYGDLAVGSYVQSTAALRLISGNNGSTHIDFGLVAISVFR
jgi:hypothetical protein